MTPIAAAFQKRLAAFPLATYQAGEIVFAAGSKTGLLLTLKKGAVAIIKEGVQIAKVAEPGAVFGEMSALLDQPHTAEVRALEASQFHAADSVWVMQDPVSLLYIATGLAWRLDVANQTLTKLKSQLQEGHPPDVVGKTIEAIEGVLSTLRGFRVDSPPD
jgi:CRP/FNR family cyclic AMP-dependent transcriptional regulator